MFIEHMYLRHLDPLVSLQNQIYDGDSTNAPLLGTFCGSEIPENITSSGNKLLVKFMSDFTVIATGFEGFFVFSNFFEGKTKTKN